MKKTLLPLTALSAALVLMVGCTTGEGAGYVAWDSTRSPADLDVTITWWNNYQQPDDGDTEANRASSTYTEYFWAYDAITEFNKLYPNITIDMQYIGSYSTILSSVNTGLSGGNIPNIATCYGDHVASYNNAGATLVMDEFMDDEYIGYGKGVDEEGNIVDDSSTAKSDLNQSYLNGEKSMYASEQYLSLPYSKSAETLAVNLDVFNAEGAGAVADIEVSDSYTVPVAAETKTKYEIPTNWKELISLARQMKVDFPDVFANQKDANGYFEAVPFVYDSAENMFISFLTMSDLPYTDASGETIADQILFNTEGAQEIVKQLKKWVDEGLICTQDQLYYTDEASGYHQYSSTLVTYGKVFMCISSTAGARYFASSDLNVGLYSTPTFTLDCLDDATGTVDESKHAVISQGPSLTFFDKADVDENYASWLFYKFLTNTENSASLAVNTSYFPIRESSYETEEVQSLIDTADYVEQNGVEENTYSYKRTAYTGQVLKLNEEYTEADDYIYSDVFDYSSDTRTACGDLLEEVFNTTISAELGTTAYETELESVVDTAFTNAYRTSVGAE